MSKTAGELDSLRISDEEYQHAQWIVGEYERQRRQDYAEMRKKFDALIREIECCRKELP